MLILLLACSDPQLDPYRAALDAWRQGRDALEAGRPAEAVDHFVRARAHDPRSPALALWEARARADAGDLPGAERVLDAAVVATPELAAAWYNRAAYRARQGHLDAAAADLEVALARGAASPFTAAADPDFAPHLDHPGLARLLPPAPLVARVEGPEGAVWVDGQVEVRLQVHGLAAPAPTLRFPEAPPAGIALQRVVEDDRVEGEVATRALTLWYRASAPALARVGPFVVQAGSAQLVLDPVTVKVEGPPRPLPPPAPHPAELPLPSALAPLAEDWTARRVAGGVCALGRPDEAVTADGQPPAVELEWRVAGQTRARGGWWPGDAPRVLAAGDWSAQR